MPSKEQTNGATRAQTPIHKDGRRREEALAKIMREPSVDIITARCALGIGSRVAYREAMNLGAQRIGSRFLFPSAKLREILGIATQAAA